jgi:hypothetical protein
MCLPPEPTITVLPGPARQPTAKPPFTVGDLRRAIPAHCFERSVLRSSAYLVADLVAVAALYFASTFIDRAPALLAWGLLWPAYWWGPRRRRGPAGGARRRRAGAARERTCRPPGARARQGRARAAPRTPPGRRPTAEPSKVGAQPARAPRRPPPPQVLPGRCLHRHLGERGRRHPARGQRGWRATCARLRAPAPRAASRPG